MRIIAGKPYKVNLKQKGETRIRWKVKLWSEDNSTGRKGPVTQKTFMTRQAASLAMSGLVERYTKQADVLQPATR